MSIPSAIAQALERIERARQATGRTDRVALELAVKTRTPEECREAAQALSDLGQPILLGHNRVQEAKATVDAIREIPGAQIHLIGPLQSNKINQALSCVDAIESIDSVALVEKIDSRAAAELPVFIEVNVSGEDTKHGCSPADFSSIAEAVATSTHLRFAGLMTVGLNSPAGAPRHRRATTCNPGKQAGTVHGNEPRSGMGDRRRSDNRTCRDRSLWSTSLSCARVEPSLHPSQFRR